MASHSERQSMQPVAKESSADDIKPQTGDELENDDNRELTEDYDISPDNTLKRRSRAEKEQKLGHRRVGLDGKITYKKIHSSQIMGSIQLGIQHNVGGLASKPDRDLLMYDFMTVETNEFDSGGTNHTPAHRYEDFVFKTYAPIAFRYFRDLFGIHPEDYLVSFCSKPLRELSNPGASGSIFYVTHDDEFIIKTIQHKEGEFLQKLLPGYYMNLNQNPRTLLPKFFGLYCYQCRSKNIRLVAMNNLLPSCIRIHEKYDLKGSTYKRKASKAELQKKSPTYKDLDFMDRHPDGLLLEADTYAALVRTIQRDCRVLESFKIMDYSLLIGIHNLDIALKERMGNEAEQTEEVEPLSLKRGSSYPVEFLAKAANSTIHATSIVMQPVAADTDQPSTSRDAVQQDTEAADEVTHLPPGGIPARNGKGERLLLFMGIIDILQSYRLKKKMEHTLKALFHDGHHPIIPLCLHDFGFEESAISKIFKLMHDTVSVHRPDFYSERFQDFMSKTVFKKIPSLDLPDIQGNHRKFRTLVSSYIALKHNPSRRRSMSRSFLQGVSDVDSSSAVGAAGSVINENEDTVTSSESSVAPLASPSSQTSQSPNSPRYQVHYSLHSSRNSCDSTSSNRPLRFPVTLRDRPLQTNMCSVPVRTPPPVPPRGVRSKIKRFPGFGRGYIPPSGTSACSTPPPGFDEAIKDPIVSQLESDATTTRTVTSTASTVNSLVITQQSIKMREMHMEERKVSVSSSGSGSSRPPMMVTESGVCSSDVRLSWTTPAEQSHGISYVEEDIKTKMSSMSATVRSSPSVLVKHKHNETQLDSSVRGIDDDDTVSDATEVTRL